MLSARSSLAKSTGRCQIGLDANNIQVIKEQKKRPEVAPQKKGRAHYFTGGGQDAAG